MKEGHGSGRVLTQKQKLVVDGQDRQGVTAGTDVPACSHGTIGGRTKPVSPACFVGGSFRLHKGSPACQPASWTCMVE